MLFKPSKEPERFTFSIFLMDSLIYFVMAGIIAFSIPFFAGLYVSYKGRGIEGSDRLLYYAISLYQRGDDLSIVLQIISISSALCFLIFTVLYRLKKKQVHSFKLDPQFLTVIKFDLLMRKKEEHIPYNKLEPEVRRETADQDKEYRIDVKGKQFLLFSTHYNKYWDVKTDRNQLDLLFTELNQKCRQ